MVVGEGDEEEITGEFKVDFLELYIVILFKFQVKLLLVCLSIYYISAM